MKSEMMELLSGTAKARTLEQRHRLRSLGAACLAHILHDGYTDLLYLLFPIWQREFGFSLALMGAMKTLFSGALSLFQLPAAKLASHFGEAVVMGVGTVFIAAAVLCYSVISSPDFLFVLLLIGGIGTAVQHPLSSSIVADAFGCSRTALATYNFAGDAGKVLLPSAAAIIIWLSDWRAAVFVLGLAGIAFGIALLWLTPSVPVTSQADPARQSARAKRDPLKPGFASVTAAGIFDNMTRTGFLTFMPLLLSQKGASPTLIGLALSLVFTGGAAGKFACGVLAERLGVIKTVIVTEVLTAFLIAALLVAPLTLLFVVLLPLGVALNGTSSVLYGSIAEIAPRSRRTDAFAWFYTAVLGAGAMAPPILGLIGDAAGLTLSIACVATLALMTLPFAMKFGYERSRWGASS